MADDKNRPDLEDAYMDDAIATARQFGMEVSSSTTISAATTGDVDAIPDDVIQGMKEVTDGLSGKLEASADKASHIGSVEGLAGLSGEVKITDGKLETPKFIVQGDDVAIEEHLAGGVARGTIKDATPETGYAAMARLARAQGSRTAGDIAAGEQPASGSFAERAVASKGAGQGQGRG